MEELLLTRNLGLTVLIPLDNQHEADAELFTDSKAGAGWQAICFLLSDLPVVKGTAAQSGGMRGRKRGTRRDFEF